MGLELQRCFRIGFHGLVKPLNRVVVPKRIQLVELEVGPVMGQDNVVIAHQLPQCLIKSNLVYPRDDSDPVLSSRVQTRLLLMRHWGS